jgi:hypothetical protein
VQNWTKFFQFSTPQEDKVPQLPPRQAVIKTGNLFIHIPIFSLYHGTSVYIYIFPIIGFLLWRKFSKELEKNLNFLQ